MVCAPVWSIIPSLKLGDYLCIQVHKPCSVSHIRAARMLKCINTYSGDGNISLILFLTFSKLEAQIFFFLRVDLRFGGPFFKGN